LKYRVELDITNEFLSPISTTINCPSANKRSVWEVYVKGVSGNPVYSGYFSLTLQYEDYSYTTSSIPFDAVATSAQETGYTKQVLTVTATVTDGSTNITMNKDVTEYIFKGDRLQFANQLHSYDVYTVASVSGTTVVVDAAVDLDLDTVTSPYVSNVYRYYGGRGTSTASRVFCKFDGSTLCLSAREQLSGSVQSEFNSIDEALVNGVDVDRDDPDKYNGVKWRITFLDDSPAGTNNFYVDVNTNNVLLFDGTTAADIDVNEIATGETYSTCTGTQVVPPDQPLVLGEGYYARVSAYNEMGYSLPQISSRQKLIIAPEVPTSIVLTQVSSTELRVQWNPPSSDGGDAVTGYKIEYSKTSNFASSTAIYVTNLSGVTPYFKTIQQLTKGVDYYVRVSATNSVGYGVTGVSTPSNLNPCDVPSAPTSVKLYSTSNSMITVSFDYPSDDGGDTVTNYRVEWDVNANFNSNSPSPYKGSITLAGATDKFYTITNLLQGSAYYVRVYAINARGSGVAAISSPNKAVPAYNIPGKPHTISAVTGVASGEIAVSWQRPRVPWHGLACSGLATAPNDCPIPAGGTRTASDGGVVISEYLVSYNEEADFSGYDSGEVTTTDLSLTLTGLTPGRKYYIRVLARNTQGSGQFCAYTDSSCLVVHTQAAATAKSS